jgi:AcrR family transcriptional regulator
MASTGTRRNARDASRYHHGDLRRTLIDAAVTTVAESGPAALSMRGLAAAAGVSHAAPVHHFGDKTGLFTAVATEGYDKLADELMGVWNDTGDFLEVGVGYVHFALSNPGHFDVMFRADLFDQDDPDLVRARERAYATMHEPLTALGRAPDAASLYVASLASWSMVHGLATLILSGNLPEVDASNPDALAREVIARLGGPVPPRVHTSRAKRGATRQAR